MAPRVGVLALQGDVREHIRVLNACGVIAVRVSAAEDLLTIDGLVIPGGESTTMSKLALRDNLMGPLREARAAGLPMFGSCAGMIMLADQVLDGRSDQETIGGLDIEVRRNAFGRQVDSFESELVLPAVGPEPFPAVFIRAPRVERAGAAVDVLGRIEEGGWAGTIVAVEQAGLLATSFHPELTGDHRIHAYFVDMVKRAAGRKL